MSNPEPSFAEEHFERMDRDPGGIRRVQPLMTDRLRKEQAQPPEAQPAFLSTWAQACRAKGGGIGPASGWLVYVAGHTGAGKTLFTLNQVHESLKAGANVLYFSLELGWEHIITRLRPIVTGREVTGLEWGKHFDAEAAEAADEALCGLPGDLLINTEPIWELEDVRAVVQEYEWQLGQAGRGGLDLIVVDYAQLIDPSGSDTHLSERMTHVSRTLSVTAQEFDLTGLVVSQANRASTRERERTPTVDSLFGSSRLGQDADQVVILDWTRQESRPADRALRTWALVAKNNHGPEVQIPVELDKSTLRFREAKPDEEDRWPGAGG